MSNTSLRFVITLTAIATVAASTGCSTTAKKDAKAVPLSETNLKALANRAKDPRIFGLTVYPSDAGPVLAGSWRTHEGEVAAINFPGTGDSTAPVVEFRPAGTVAVDALLDTSSPQSWSTMGAFKSLNMELLAAPSLLESRPAHVYDEVSGYLAVVPRLNIERITLENALVQVRAATGPLGPLARNVEKVEVVLGMDAIRAFNHVQFVFPSRFVLFSATSDAQPDDAKVLAAVPQLSLGGALGAEGMMDGQPAKFVIDTAGDFAVALATNAAGGTLKQVSVGDLVFRDVQSQPGLSMGLGPIQYPRIGRRLLSRLTLTVDNRAKVVRFERP